MYANCGTFAVLIPPLKHWQVHAAVWLLWQLRAAEFAVCLGESRSEVYWCNCWEDFEKDGYHDGSERSWKVGGTRLGDRWCCCHGVSSQISKNTLKELFANVDSGNIIAIIKDVNIIIVCSCDLILDQLLGLTRTLYAFHNLSLNGLYWADVPLTIVTLYWRVYCNWLWSHFREFRSAQLVWYWISGNEIMLSQLWSSYTGCQCTSRNF